MTFGTSRRPLSPVNSWYFASRRGRCRVLQDVNDQFGGFGMSPSIGRHPALRRASAAVIALATAGVGSTGIFAQSKPAAPVAQKLDADYTAKIKAATADPRILTELVDHIPASDKVPSPLKFF